MPNGPAIDLTRGDVVNVDPDAESRYRPTAKAWVVGLPEGGPITAERCVTIEFEDGADVEIPAGLLRLIDRPGEAPSTHIGLSAGRDR